MLILDSFLNECCFKGSSMDLKVQRNKNDSPIHRTLESLDSLVLRTPGSLDSPALLTPGSLSLSIYVLPLWLRPSGIAELCWRLFCKLWSVPFIKWKFYDGPHQPLKRTFNIYIYSTTHLDSRETVPSKLTLQNFQ